MRRPGNEDTVSGEDKEQLEQYKQKRDFRSTVEPAGEISRSEGEPIFVIQKHDASTLHYDFRLEVDGVLKSWAVPKGPSTDPRQKRLAVPTEDHPLEYADFEGAIPEDQYGAGAVIIWDRGTYRNNKDPEDGDVPSVAEQIKEGHATVWLEGEKLQGGYALIRTGGGDDARWLLIKMKDEKADARRNPTSTEPESVVSGKTIEEVAEDAGKDDDT